MSVTDELLKHNEDYAARFEKGDFPMLPARKVAIARAAEVRPEHRA